MSNTIFDLKDFRENVLKKTQAEFADMIGVRQDNVSRMEKDPESISISSLVSIAQATGTTLDQLLSYEKPKMRELKPEDTWADTNYMKKSVISYLEHTDTIELSCHKNGLEKIEAVAATYVRKPKIVFIGRSDSGKSTMINNLIGRDKMPTSWTPTTSIIVYIKHIDDRPAFIKDELWILKKDKSESWDDTRLNDENYCKEWKLASGSAELLADYGTRKGTQYDSNMIGAAVLFVDSPMLKDCDLLDVPGFTGGIESDNKNAGFAQEKADVLVYLSQVGGGFMSNEDFTYLKTSLKLLTPLERMNNGIEPLGNLFVVGTQAHVINRGNEEKIREILDDGAERFYESLTRKIWEDRSSISGIAYSLEDFKKRFFSYTTDIERLSIEFEKSLRELIEKIPIIVKENGIDIIRKACGEIIGDIDAEIDKYKALLHDREKYVELLDMVSESESARKIESLELYHNLKDKIPEYNFGCRDGFGREYATILSEDHILSVIREKKLKSKKADIQKLCAFINSELEDKIEGIIAEESADFSKEVEEFVKDFQGCCEFKKTKINFSNVNTFNSKRAFAAGLSGLGTIGALSLWASACGSLGGYILIAKGVSLLSALGISVGGTAVATSAVATIGGPITIGIALAVIAATMVFAIATGGWQKKIAKKIRESYDEQNALYSYNQCIESVWVATAMALDKAYDHMESEWQRYISDLREAVDNYNGAELENNIKKAKESKHFFGNIPL